ncbi:MAG: hypothetical protein ACOZAO_00360 [Patescibacteria group bacterium]
MTQKTKQQPKGSGTFLLFQLGLASSVASLIFAFLVGWTMPGYVHKFIVSMILVNVPLLTMWMPYMHRDQDNLLASKNISTVGVFIYGMGVLGIVGIGHWLRFFETSSNLSNLGLVTCILLYAVGLTMFTTKLRKN